MTPLLKMNCFAFFVFVIAALAPPTVAQTIEFVKSQDFPDFPKHGKDQTEASAVEPLDAGGSLLLIADDEQKGFWIFDVAAGKLREQPLVFDKVDKKPKWEAMARDDEGAFYVVGQHAVKIKNDGDDAKKLAQHSRLFRFQVKAGAATIGEAVEWDIKDALKSEEFSLDPIANKVKIEALAIRTRHDATGKTRRRELLIGFREGAPKLGALARVYTADITVLPRANAKLALQPLFGFDAGEGGDKVKMKLSSLEYAPAWQGFFILTSAEASDGTLHGSALWFVSDEEICAAPKSFASNAQSSDFKLVSPKLIKRFDANLKAEGICVLAATAASNSEPGTARLAVVFDNDDKGAGKIQFLEFRR